MPEPIYAGLSPNVSRVVFALDLTINGEEFRLREPFPLDIWETLDEAQRAELKKNALFRAATETLEHFADLIAVRVQRPGQTLGQVMGAETRRALTLLDEG